MVNRLTFMRVALSSLFTMAALTAGCTDLPSYSRVDRLRVLGIRADPPELLDDPLPPEVSFDALVVDAAGRPVELSWQFCPVQSGSACLDYDDRLGEATENLDNLLEGLNLGSTSGTPGDSAGENACPLSEQSAQGLAALVSTFGGLSDPDTLTERYRASVESATFVLGQDASADVRLRGVDLSFFETLVAELRACNASFVPASFDPSALPESTSDLHLFHFLSAPLQSMVGVWPSVVLTAAAGDDTLTAFKRLPLSFRHPSAPLALVRFFAPTIDFGVPLCAPGNHVGPSAGPAADGCLDVAPRVPNQNPVFSDISIAEGQSASNVFHSIKVSDNPLTLEPIVVVAGTSMRILPEFTPESFQAYQTLNVNLQTQALEVRSEIEEISVSWFVSSAPREGNEGDRNASHGTLQDSLTWPKFTKTLDTVYTAPTIVPDEPVRLWLVARDQRGGVSWQELRVEVLPLPIAVE